MDIELLPCPFCGKPPTDCPDDSYGGGCIGCTCDLEPMVSYAAGDKDSKDEAVKKWNTRAGEQE